MSELLIVLLFILFLLIILALYDIYKLKTELFALKALDTTVDKGKLRLFELSLHDIKEMLFAEGIIVKSGKTRLDLIDDSIKELKNK